jgi:ATP-binding cassette, subfamily B, bacterial
VAAGRPRLHDGRVDGDDAEENERLAALTIRQQLVSRGFFAVVSTFFSVTPVLVYLLAGLELAHGGHGLTAGTVVAVTTLQSRLFQPIAQALTTATEVSGSVALFRRSLRLPRPEA